MIDMRSDTVSKPSAAMLDAMRSAEVGDDVFGEDPTVIQLESRLARMFGHEAGLFCPSGTMTNQIAIQAHTRRGDEVICHENAHIYNYEGGGIARNSGASCKLVRNESGLMKADEVDALINADHDWLARTSLVSVEDTTNRGGGKCYDFEDLAAISKRCKHHNLPFHLDGARIFNALVKKGHDPVSYGQLFDSISICLSKGLGAPVGSVLIGRKEFIKEARRVRKVMGGGMRQAGYLAAAGLYALDHNVNRLNEDHERAAFLAGTLRELKKVKHVIIPETNILIFDIHEDPGSESVLTQLDAEGLKLIAFGKNRIRLVTHLDLSDGDVLQSAEILKKVLSQLNAKRYN